MLSAHVVKGPSFKERFKIEVIDEVFYGDGVQWHWLLLSQDIDSKDDSSELLKAVITLWVATREFSLCALWMENYKQVPRRQSGYGKDSVIKNALDAEHLMRVPTCSCVCIVIKTVHLVALDCINIIILEYQQ